VEFFLKSVKKGDKIKVEYEGTLEDGTVFDSSKMHNAPLEFTVGEKQLIQGFDNGVIGMKVGEEKELVIQPDEGYGEYNPEFVKDMPRDSFPSEQEIKAGMMFMAELQDGKQVPVRISDVTEEKVTIDLNPPLAGKTLIFKVKLLEIVE